jgi:3-(3-hydroxy-phenyl)propionate hydroxylase
VSRLFRDAVLELAKKHTFARTLVNSGRLSVPATLHGSTLNTADAHDFKGRMVPGTVAADAPVVLADGSVGWLLDQSRSTGFTAVVFGTGRTADGTARAISQGAASVDVPVATVRIPLDDAHALAAKRYDARDGTVYLLRPDQHICGRWRQVDTSVISAALHRALAKA